jgi:kinesin family protein C1
MEQQQAQCSERMSSQLPRTQLKPPSSAPSSSSQSTLDLDQDDVSGLSALERYRLRKARQQQQQQQQQQSSALSSSSFAAAAGGGGSASNNYSNSNQDEGVAYAVASASAAGTPSRTTTTSRLPPTYGAASSSLSSSSSFADEDDNPTAAVAAAAAGGSSSYSVGTPSRRGKSSSSRMSLCLGGGAQRRGIKRRTTPGMDMQQGERKLRPLMIPPSYSAPSNDGGELQQQQQQHQYHQDDYDATSGGGGGGGTIDYHPQPPPSFSQESVESYNSTTTTTTTNNVDGMAMQSRIAAMQRRIENLEREKMDLAMSKAPLEARIRQKEDAWVKERERLLCEINNFQDLARETDERYRELEMKNEALEEETMKLRLEARAANIDNYGGTTDSWSERVKSNNEIKGLRREVKSKDDEIRALRIEKMSLESEVFAYQKDIETYHRDYENLEKDYKELEGSQSQNCEAQIQLEVLTTEHTAMTAQLNATCADLEEIKTRAKADIDAKEQQWKNREKELLFEMSVLKSRAGKSADDDLDMENGDVDDPAVLKARIEERDRRIAELEEQLLSGEQLRRALHNRIQELRGNIRVFVRTRPFLPNDGAASNSSIDIMPDGESLSIQGKYAGEGHSFKFDKVFAPSAGQGVVFEEVSEFVQSALDGYNVCLFSYGQTGSGKTHTMQGSGNGAMRGIIPRAVEQILQQAALMQSQRWKFTMKASFLEIYNEDLRDLLVMMNSDGSLKQRDTASAPKLSIKRDQDGKSYVEGINKVDIDVEDKATGLAQLEAVMVAAARARSVATTKMNAQSSRSHSVFMLHLCGSNEESGTIVEGALNLCDLAGSERLDRSGAGSDHKRLKETQAINKSLSSLGDVFTSLANGSKHIPFRNSKLTYLLQDCLSGDGKALMFVNLSPTVESSNESLCSLRFAQRVNAVELGKAVKHVQYGSKVGSGKK